MECWACELDRRTPPREVCRNNKSAIEERDQAIADLTAERDAAEALVDKLAKTKDDGRPIVPGETYFVPSRGLWQTVDIILRNPGESLEFRSNLLSSSIGVNAEAAGGK